MLYYYLTKKIQEELTYTVLIICKYFKSEHIAFTYTLTPVLKRKQISDFSKIQQLLGRRPSYFCKNPGAYI